MRISVKFGFSLLGGMLNNKNQFKDPSLLKSDTFAALLKGLSTSDSGGNDDVTAGYVSVATTVIRSNRRC